MEILHHFEYDKAKMNICRSTSFKEKLFIGNLFCHYSDENGIFPEDEDSYREIKEEDIPICIRYSKFINQCLDDYHKLGDKEKYWLTGLGPYNFRILGNNKYEIWNSDRDPRKENMKFIQFFFKEKFKYNYYDRIVIEWDNENNWELITIEGLYPEKIYWNPVQIQGIPFEGLFLHSYIYNAVGRKLYCWGNPYRAYGLFSQAIIM